MKRISDSIEKLLQAQIINENNSARLYKSMKEWLDYNAYRGAADLYKAYYKEELCHVNKHYNYLQDRGCMPVTPALPSQPTPYKDLGEILIRAYENAVEATKQVLTIVHQAEKEGDSLTVEFMRWFVKDQIEEEEQAQYWVARYKFYKTTNSPLSSLDREMHHRSRKY